MDKLKTYWSNLSIRSKLLSYLFTIIFLISFFSLYINNSNYKTMDYFNEGMIGYYKINALRLKIQENHHYIENYLHREDQETLDKFYSTEAEIETLINWLDTKFVSQEAVFILTAIRNSVNAYMENWEIAIQEKAEGVETYYNAYYKGAKIYMYTKNYCLDLLTLRLGEGTIAYNERIKQAKIKRKTSWILMAMILIIALTMGVIFSNYLVRPIKALAKSSKSMAEGDLDVEAIVISRKDEVGVLAETFNTMSAHIQKYVKDLEQKVIIEQKLHDEEMAVIRMVQSLQVAEFQALQSQINPHFLFNTLNTIARTAMFEEAEDTVKLIQALSSLFRYRIRNCEDLVSVEEEVGLIREYLYLQKVRFKGRLVFEINMEEACKKMILPVFTLQPLVENAIIHGIEPKMEGGHVRIRLYRKNNKVIIKVTDTGIGMEKEQYEKLIEKLKKKETKGIGVANVYNRFKLYFKESGVFKIYSRVGKGTSIKLTVDKEV